MGQTDLPHASTAARWIASKGQQARVSIGLAGLALLASVATLAAKLTTTKTIGIALLVVGVLIGLLQVAARTYLFALELEEKVKALVGQGEVAASELQQIKQTAKQELQLEERLNKRLELLFMALKEFDLIKVRSLDALRDSRPATLFYLQRHMTAIADVLAGHWDRSEFLRPPQLWREYGQLMARMQRGETFRSTVCVPIDSSVLLNDDEFQGYVNAIYAAAGSQGVQVKRIYVLGKDNWPLNQSALPPEVLEHLRELKAVEDDRAALLEGRVTIERIARDAFHDHPDFMIWGDGLLIQSDLGGADGLVTQAEFYFAANHHADDVTRRQKQFDNLFNDPNRALPLSVVLSG